MTAQQLSTWVASAISLMVLTLATGVRADDSPGHAQLRLQGIEGWLHMEQMEQKVRHDPDLSHPAKEPRHDAKVVKVPRENVIIETVPGIDRDVYEHFVNEDVVWYPRHPSHRPEWGESRVVPYDPEAQPDSNVKEWTFRPTASRSLIHKDPFFSVKLPTNRTEGIHDKNPRSSKTDLSLRLGIRRAEHISNVDKRLGKPDGLVIQRDVLSIHDRESGNGFHVRDLSDIKENHYYIPGFAIPFVGERFAEANGEEFSPFWRKHAAEAVGRAVAQVLLHYGLTLENPHAQNWLIELDDKKRPTGRVIFRDMDDTLYHEKIAKALGFEDRVANDERRKTEDSIRPKGALPDLKDHLDYAERSKWKKAYGEAYAKTLSDALGMDIDPRDGMSEQALERLTDWWRKKERQHKRSLRGLARPRRDAARQLRLRRRGKRGQRGRHRHIRSIRRSPTSGVRAR